MAVGAQDPSHPGTVRTSPEAPVKHLHYLEIENFKRFGASLRIDLDHPSVLIGPNNCGKTTALQAIALWSQAVRTWFDRKGQAPPAKRTSTSLNRLAIAAVPVRRTRHFWPGAVVRRGNQHIPLRITLGVEHGNEIHPVTMQFRNEGDDLVYCTPDKVTLADPGRIDAAARIRVDLLPPMSGLALEEPILTPRRIDVLLGQGRTAEVLRNLCFMVWTDTPEDWERVRGLMERLFQVKLTNPEETSDGILDLQVQQDSIRQPLDLSLAGRGFQQTLLILAYLYSHRGSVLLIDEPDAHLEFLRQRQIHVLLRRLAAENDSQVILVTHSEIVLQETRDHHLTLLLAGRTETPPKGKSVQAALRRHGAASWVRARQRGHVLYVEGTTDVRILEAFAKRLDHPAARFFESSVNPHYIQDPFPEANLESDLQRVEDGFDKEPLEHFGVLKALEPELQGLALLDSDGKNRQDRVDGDLRTCFWQRYEIENYFVTPELLERYAGKQLAGSTLFRGFTDAIRESLDKAVTKHVFAGAAGDFETWKRLDDEPRRLLWEAKTHGIKLGALAEDFFETLAERTGRPPLLRKGDFDRLVEFLDPDRIPREIRDKLDLITQLEARSHPRDP